MRAGVLNMSKQIVENVAEEGCFVYAEFCFYDSQLGFGCNLCNWRVSLRTCFSSSSGMTAATRSLCKDRKVRKTLGLTLSLAADASLVGGSVLVRSTRLSLNPNL